MWVWCLVGSVRSGLFAKLERVGVLFKGHACGVGTPRGFSSFSNMTAAMLGHTLGRRVFPGSLHVEGR